MKRWSLAVLVAAATALALWATWGNEKTAGDSAYPAWRTPLGWVGEVGLLAGDGVRGARDGAPAQARFDDPFGLARAEDGTVYVADAGDNNRIRRIHPDGRVDTLAGAREGFADGRGDQAAFHTPSALALAADGTIYVADTGNHAIRRIAPDGMVTTLAGDGQRGFVDGRGTAARFDGPMGLALAADGRLYVADSYNDRIRVIETDGNVRTVAGDGVPGWRDGPALSARFDTPVGIALDRHGTLWVADTGNDALRRLHPDGSVETRMGGDPARRQLYRPMSVAVTADDVVYLGELVTGRILQVSPSGHVSVPFGLDEAQRFARPASLLALPDHAVLVTDATAHRVHRLAPLPLGQLRPRRAELGPSMDDPLPRTASRWPLHPQLGWHEVVGTLGEVRGNFRGDNRDHLHTGFDVRGDVGQRVLAVADAKIDSPLPSGSAGGQAENLALHALTYIHMKVGRDAGNQLLDPARFQLLRDEQGRISRVRVRRGTRFSAGDALGTINNQAHVHLALGARGFERNAVSLGFANFVDTVPPVIDHIAVLDAAGQVLPQAGGRVLVDRADGPVQVVVEAWDQVDGNLPRRRLGLHALGYALLDASGRRVPDASPDRPTVEFDRTPPQSEAVKLAYAEESGITVHGSARTRFQYVITNEVRDGDLRVGGWNPATLPAGDYVLRVLARDASGNEAIANRDLPLRLQ